MLLQNAGPFLIFAPLLASAAPSCSLKPPRSAAVSASSGIQSGGAANGSDVVASAWYPGWVDFTASSISWDKYNAMTFAFGLTTSDVNTIEVGNNATLPEFVSAAKDHGVAALLSIGGWTGSQYFSPAVATPDSRTAFVNTVLGLVKQYDLDGIDFDWEYPGRKDLGMTCNQVNSADSANFLLFLQELRKTDVGKNLTLTAAVGLTPFSDGTAPMTDVSQFAAVLDRIAIMSYDIWGQFSATAGPNAPLDDSCAPTKAGSATSAVKAWTSAKFPANQITLGVAAYGHSFNVTSTAAKAGSNSLALYPAFEKAPMATTVDSCGGTESVDDTIPFADLISKGFLNSNGTAADGMLSVFDSCSQTPFVYNPQSGLLVSYDDATSFAAKGKFINDQGLGGFAVWESTGDKDDILLDSLHQAMGIQPDCS
ncbi:glycoside hydrolase family 18 protein [Mycena belliarum]|uniref:Glycoside hydrolase family 18 protein n=1 Tax=Mycena belliarum TaxID=1033014 RepID=A0AAD6XMN1_9AGAR|nr:glycoside hydrolase family 18 protein [Mycena belliae]